MMPKGMHLMIFPLLLFSVFTPMVLSIDAGVDTGVPNSQSLDDQLAFICYDDGFPYSGKLSVIKERLSYIREKASVDSIGNSLFTSVSSTRCVGDDGLMDSPWPMKCHDTRHSGRSPYSTSDNNGVVYFGDFWGYLYAVYPDGTLKWRYKTGDTIWSSPAIGSDGTVYVGSYDGYLYAVNSDGHLKWKTKIGTTSSSPVIGDDGTIYTGTMGNKVYAINPDGAIKWCYQTGYKITSDPALGEDGTIYIGSGDTYFYAINPNGTLKWRYKTGHYVKGPPSIDKDGTIYIGSWDDYLYALYPNGSLKWKCKVGSGTETNPSIGPDGIIYVGGDKLYAVNPDGTIKWSFNLGKNQHIHQSSPAISSDGIIYVGTNIGETSGGDIIAINPDGTERWRQRIANDWVDSSPCIGKNGVIYIGSSSTDENGSSYGYLYAFGHGNIPPDKPTINGPSNGRVGETYSYTFTAVDGNNDNIFYYIKWGDGSRSGWIGPYHSGETIILNHTWNRRGSFVIQAKAKDIYGLESGWSTLEVSMPKNNNPIWFIIRILFLLRN